MKTTRRTFIKGSAGGGGTAVAARFLYGAPETLVAAAPEAAAAAAEEWVPSTCWIGKQDCGLLARRINGRVVKLEGNPQAPVTAAPSAPRVSRKSRPSTTPTV